MSALPASAAARVSVLAEIRSAAESALAAIKAGVDLPLPEFSALVSRSMRPMARLAVAEYVDSCWFGFDPVGDRYVAGEDGGPEFLALRSALVADSPEWPALARSFVSSPDPFPDMSESELEECCPGLPAARRALAALRD